MKIRLLTAVLLVYCSIDILAETVFESDKTLRNILFKEKLVYIGAVNTIYKLNENLVELKQAVTGPRNDSKLCVDQDISCERKDLTDNWNTVLVIYPYNGRGELLTCGSIFQGSCQLRSSETLNVMYNGLRAVAANDNVSSTVAFVSQGQVAGGTIIPVLNIAVTQYNRLESMYLPTVSVRRADQLNSRMFLKVAAKTVIEAKRSYDIDYINGFSIDQVSYFTAVRPKKVGSTTYYSELIRFCPSDIDFSTYTEIPLKCVNNAGVDFNIMIAGSVFKATGKSAQIFNVTEGEQLLMGVFSKSLPNQKKQTESNQVCVYSLKDINAAFLANLRECVINKKPADGGLTWMKSTLPGCAEASEEYLIWIKTARDHPEADLSVACAKLPFLRNFAQGGFIPLMPTRSFPISGKPAKIKPYPHDRGFSFFTGSVNGLVRRYSLSASLKTHVYVEQSFSSNAVRALDTHPTDMEYLYILTKNRLTKSSLKDCAKRTSCIDCLAGPYCGWCSLQKKCTLKTECQNSDNALYFVNDTDTKCPTLASVTPKPAAIPVTIQTKITWTITNLPKPQNGQQYTCSFGDKKSAVTVNGNQYSCDTPKYGEIPGTDTVTSKVVNVQFKSPFNQVSLFSINVEFYNCGLIQSCLQCTKFKYKCNWCQSSLSCLDYSVKSCSNPIYHAGPEQSTGLSACPRVTGINTLYISSGVDRHITVPGANYPAPTAAHQFQCKVSIEGADVITSASRKDTKTVVCDKRTYTFARSIANYSAGVTVLFGGKPLDAVYNIQVSIYKCEVKRDDCSVCLDAPKVWQCGWCGKKHCAVHDACSSNWVNKSCPSPPQIISFSPKSGSIYGSTNLKIEGRDLGLQKSDIGNITVAGKLCRFLPNLYVQSKTVYCKTSSVPKPVGGVIQIYVKFGEKMMKIETRDIFMYKKPSVVRFAPTKAPCSGGTLLTIFGDHLDVGATVTITAAGKPCILKNRNSSMIFCVTSNSCSSRKRRNLQSGSVAVTFDGKTVKAQTAALFIINPDPEIFSVNTYKLITVDSKKTSLETFVSGGQVFIVKGDRFDLIQNPRMKFTTLATARSKSGQCLIKSPSVMNCIAPNVTDLIGAVNMTVSIELGFVLQNVHRLLSFQNITVGPDPFFYPIGRQVDLESRNLVLRGKNLHVLGNEDVVITVANLPCVVQNIRDTLFCIAPNISMVKDHKDDAIVKAYIGKGGLQSTLGSVRYVQRQIKDGSLKWQYIAIAAAIGAILIVVIIIFCVLYRRRRKKEKKYEKVYQNRLDNLESRYAAECKEAFAELQTEMTDLTTDMSTSAIPYLNFETYAVRLLFPGSENHPITERDCNKSDSWKRCMSSFCELLKEKEFLLTFVKTLESQHQFGMRDRCKVASLLTVTLQDDMKYVTDILQELLADLIEKSVNSSRAKLLLRRTESVAEKLLTNWLSYTLYEFLQQRVGDPLFKLFSAIVSLLEKEPVDVIACEARNSLSEDRLLRQKVNFKTITAHVEYDGDDNIAVQLLNCDSVNQAKEKILNVIYRHVPYSKRPNRDALVLVYLTPTGGEKILRQEDNTCEVEGEWKRINTLEHFLIPDGCQLKLMPFTLYSDGTGTPVFHDTSMPNVSFIPSHSSTPMLNNHHNHADEDFKLWHLVKSSDYPAEQKEDIRQNKMMAEVYLTRLLKTKFTLQNFVDALFEAIFTVSKNEQTIPPAMKFLFDFLDKQAACLASLTPKCCTLGRITGCLPLKFWINIIKNPNFVFDINKTSIVDSCLSVTAQLFMDSCSPEEHRLSKDSPSNKLLYAKEIPEYKKKVKGFYSDVKALPAAKDKELNESLSVISIKYGAVFNHYNAASDIMTYAVKHKVKIMDALEKENLEEYADKLQSIMENLPDD
eukprot:gene7554-8391_t